MEMEGVFYINWRRGCGGGVDILYQQLQQTLHTRTWDTLHKLTFTMLPLSEHHVKSDTVIPWTNISAFYTYSLQAHKILKAQAGHKCKQSIGGIYNLKWIVEI